MVDSSWYDEAHNHMLRALDANLEMFRCRSVKDINTFWVDYVMDKPFFHGTNSVSYQRILQEQSLNPHIRIWDDDLYELAALCQKVSYPLPPPQFTSNVISLTPIVEYARDYARTSPELWTNLIGVRSNEPDDLLRATRRLNHMLCYGFFETNKWHFADVKTFHEILGCIKDIAYHSHLSIDEVTFANNTFQKYWNMFSGSQPILLVFSAQALQDMEGFEMYWNQESFCDALLQCDESVLKGVLVSYLSSPEIVLDQAVSLEYLKAVEVLEDS